MPSRLSDFDENAALDQYSDEEAEMSPGTAKRKAEVPPKAGNNAKPNAKPIANASSALNKGNGQGQFQNKNQNQNAQQQQKSKGTAGPAGAGAGAGPLADGIDEVVTLKGLNADGTVAEGDVELKVHKKARRKFDERILTNRDGLLRIYQEFPAACKFRGIGHEAQDAKLLINKYKEWAFQLYPNLAFPDMLSRCESLGGKAAVRSYAENLRERERCRYLNEVLGIDLALIRVPDRKKAAVEEEADVAKDEADDSSSGAEDEEGGWEGEGEGGAERGAGGARRGVGAPDLTSPAAATLRDSSGSGSAAAVVAAVAVGLVGPLGAAPAVQTAPTQATWDEDEEAAFAEAEKAIFEYEQQLKLKQQQQQEQQVQQQQEQQPPRPSMEVDPADEMDDEGVELEGTDDDDDDDDDEEEEWEEGGEGEEEAQLTQPQQAAAASPPKSPSKQRAAN